MHDYYALVEDMFDFLAVPGEKERLHMLGFYKQFPLRKDPWCFQCGYWNMWFVLSFQIDYRDRLHFLSLSRRSPGNILLAVEYYDLERFLSDRVPGWVSPNGDKLDENGVRAFLNAYARAFRCLDGQALTPKPGEGFGEWLYDEFEKYRVEVWRGMSD